MTDGWTRIKKRDLKRRRGSKGGNHRESTNKGG